MLQTSPMSSDTPFVGVRKHSGSAVEGAMMQTWVGEDERGAQYLVRTGTGVVTAVLPVGIVDPDGGNTIYRIEIYCDAPHGRPGSIRYSAHPLVPADDPLYKRALEALDQVWAVMWTVEWHRHDWIPSDVPVAALNLTTDARSLLVGLEHVTVPETMDYGVPDFVPAVWRATLDE
jgi:hypothetical protein